MSNAREHRLLSIILELKKADTQRLARLPKSANDVEFAASLAKEDILAKDEIDNLLVLQIERIIVAALSWPDGEFVFSPLVKPREDLVFQIDFHKVLIDYARCQPAAGVAERFKSVQESFDPAPERELHASLHSHELFVLQRFGGESMNIERLKAECSLPESGLLTALYVLWLGGLLFRRDWNAAFSANRIAAIRNAKVSLVKQAQKMTVETNGNALTVDSVSEPEPEQEAKVPEPPMIDITLEEYLERTEDRKSVV